MPRTFSPILLEAHNPGPLTGGGNHTYLVIGSRGTAALIDAGVGEPLHLAALDRTLEARSARLDSVLVTHAHVDHASGAPAIRSRHAATFAKYPWAEEDKRYDVPWQPLADGQAVVVDDVRLIVLHTPGHSPDHVVFWHDQSRTVFAGDLVIQGSSVMIDTSHGGRLQDYLTSLERLRSLDARRLLPAHGPSVDNPAALVDQYLEHRRLREGQVLAALRAGRATVQEIAESIYDGLAPAVMAAARENVRAHLEKLRAEGRAVDQEGRWRP